MEGEVSMKEGRGEVRKCGGGERGGGGGEVSVRR